MKYTKQEITRKLSALTGTAAYLVFLNATFSKMLDSCNDVNDIEKVALFLAPFLAAYTVGDIVSHTVKPAIGYCSNSPLVHQSVESFLELCDILNNNRTLVVLGYLGVLGGLYAKNFETASYFSDLCMVASICVLVGDVIKNKYEKSLLATKSMNKTDKPRKIFVTKAEKEARSESPSRY